MPSPKKKAANKKPTPPLSNKTPSTAELVEALKAKKAEMKDVLQQMDNVAAAPAKIDPDIVSKAVEAAKTLDGQPYAHGGLVAGGGGSYNGTITTSAGAGNWTVVGNNYSYSWPTNDWKPMGVASESPKAKEPEPSELIIDISTWMHEQWPNYSVKELVDGNLKTKGIWANYDNAVATLVKRIEQSQKWGNYDTKYNAILDKLKASKHNPHAGVVNGQNVQFGQFEIGQASQSTVKHDVAVWLALKWPSFTVEGLKKNMGDEYDTYDGALKAVKECMKYCGHEEQKKYAWVLQKLQYSHHNTTGLVEFSNLSSPPPATPKPYDYDIVALIEAYWPPKDSKIHQVNLNTWGSYSHDKIVKQLQYRIGVSSGHNEAKWKAILNTVQGAAPESLNNPKYSGIITASGQIKASKIPANPFFAPPSTSIDSEPVAFVPYDGSAAGARATALSMVNGDCSLVLPMAFHKKMGTYHKHVFLDTCRTVIGEGMKNPAQHIHQMKRAKALLDAAKALESVA